MRFRELEKFYKRAETTGPKSVKIAELDPEWYIDRHSGIQIHYLDGIKKDIETREDE